MSDKIAPVKKYAGAGVLAPAGVQGEKSWQGLGGRATNIKGMML